MEIRGKRTFALASPGDGLNFSQFSFMHEHHRQVRVGEYVPTKHVELQPGDVLFVPSFTFHEVSSPAGEISIGINIFSNCEERDAVAYLRDVQLPACIIRAEATHEGGPRCKYAL